MKAATLSIVTLLLLASCHTTPAPLSPHDPAEIYFQRAQAATDQNLYDEALVLYRSFLDNHPDATHEESFSARYEIALLLSKQGHTGEAMAGYESILSDFDDLEKSSGAPGWVKVLSTKKLQELKDRATKPKP